MEIQEIKQRLTMAQVLTRYSLKPDKHLRLCCPFHEDKTPSMQVYYKTHTAYCFSSNCPTYGKSLDVIDFREMHQARSYFKSTGFYRNPQFTTATAQTTTKAGKPQAHVRRKSRVLK